jgi:hypothetical protein
MITKKQIAELTNEELKIVLENCECELECREFKENRKRYKMLKKLRILK